MPHLVQNSFFFKQEHTGVVAYKDTCKHGSAVTANIMHRVFFFFVYSQESNGIVPLII